MLFSFTFELFVDIIRVLYCYCDKELFDYFSGHLYDAFEEMYTTLFFANNEDVRRNYSSYEEFLKTIDVMSRGTVFRTPSGPKTIDACFTFEITDEEDGCRHINITIDEFLLYQLFTFSENIRRVRHTVFRRQEIGMFDDVLHEEENFVRLSNSSSSSFSASIPPPPSPLSKPLPPPSIFSEEDFPSLH